MRVSVPRVVYSSECILLAVQQYLLEYHVSILEDGANIAVSITPKNETDAQPLEEVFLNHLNQSAFRYQHQRDTAALRRILMDKAFSLYGEDS
jgi:His-Xaa-Ser system protein HxsD